LAASGAVSKRKLAPANRLGGINDLPPFEQPTAERNDPVAPTMFTT
jgi:hypothetical protein